MVVMVMVVVVRDRLVHHAHILRPSPSLKVAPDEDGRYAEEDDVEVGGVVPVDACLDNLGVAGGSRWSTTFKPTEATIEHSIVEQLRISLLADPFLSIDRIPNVSTARDHEPLAVSGAVRTVV